jgi:hypothetical protein
MFPELGSRRQVLRYLGGGAIAGSTAVYGLGSVTQDARAQVALSFEDATVDLPEDDTIDDLRITGDVSGDFETGGEPSELVELGLDVEMDRFGGFEDSVDRHPEVSQGTVDWAPTYSLLERTDMDGEGDLQSASFDNNTVSYNVTANATMNVFADGYLTAEASDGATGTITFRDPAPTGTDGNESETGADASVSISFGFEVDK